MKHLLLLLLLCFSQNIMAQQTKKILFIGNSYTFYNTLPAMLNDIAMSHGDTVIHSSSTFGGAQLVQHATRASTLNLIRQGGWDFVVIQEQSQKPSFPDAQVATDVYPYAAQLNDSILAYNPCAETVFFMTWGRKNGDQQNCTNFPPLCTFDGMNARLRRAYLQMSLDNDAIAAPVGAVWKTMRDTFSWVELYAGDGSHPSYAGSYLAASTFYATLFRKPLTGTTYSGSLADSTAAQIHQMVDLVVLDSLANWYIGAYDVQADFLYNVNYDVVVTNNTSQNAIAYQWDFGDGSPIDTNPNPMHTYAASGNYTMQLIAIDSCLQQDTFQQSVVIAPLSSVNSQLGQTSSFSCFPNPSNGEITLQSEHPIQSIQIFNSLGKEIFYQKNSIETEKSIYLSNQVTGIYYIHVVDNQNTRFVQKLVLQ